MSLINDALKRAQTDVERGPTNPLANTVTGVRPREKKKGSFLVILVIGLAGWAIALLILPDKDSTRSVIVNAFDQIASGSDIFVDRQSIAQIIPPQIPGENAVSNSSTPLAVTTGTLGEFDVTAMLRALSQKSGSDLLSAPKVTVLSGDLATIKVAQELLYPQRYSDIEPEVGSGSSLSGGTSGGSAGVAIAAGTPQDFTSRDIGVELTVTPRVEEDDYSLTLD